MGLIRALEWTVISQNPRPWAPGGGTGQKRAQCAAVLGVTEAGHPLATEQQEAWGRRPGPLRACFLHSVMGTLAGSGRLDAVCGQRVLEQAGKEPGHTHGRAGGSENPGRPEGGTGARPGPSPATSYGCWPVVSFSG